MSNISKSKQARNGKAFEYALLLEFFEKLERTTSVEVIESPALFSAKECFDSFNSDEQSSFLLSASFAVNFIIDLEPRLSHDVGVNDILQLEIVSDDIGQTGDVRDVIAIRLEQQWEIGISAKNNHKAVKHSRLSTTLDFGGKWIDLPCSQEYFNDIAPVFSNLEDLRKKSEGEAKWSDLGCCKTDIYVKVLDAFRDELRRLSTQPGCARKLVEYLVGTKDFYKVIKGKSSVEIQAYNLHGTLNQSINQFVSKYKVPQLTLPTRFVDISYKDGSKTTLIVDFDNGWKMSFRIHNASSRIEASLKFDVNLLSSPHTLFKSTLTIK